MFRACASRAARFAAPSSGIASAARSTNVIKSSIAKTSTSSRRMFGSAGASLGRGQLRMAQAAAGAGFVGLGALAAYGMERSRHAESIPGAYSSAVQANISSAYRHLGGGLGLTGAFAYAFHRMGVSSRVASLGTIPGLVLSLGLTVGTMYWCMSTPMQNTGAKYASWTAFNASIALFLSPLAFLGGSVVYSAAMGTGAIVGSLSLVASLAPDDKFANWGGGLAIGLGAVAGSGIASMFFPQVAMLQNIWLYGGLALFGAFVLYDTQRMRKQAQLMPPSQFDPISASMGIYMDTINIFVRLVQIFAGNSKNRR